MRCISISAEKQKDVEVNIFDGTAHIYLRANHAEKTGDGEGSEGGSFWECEEAYMTCDADDAPTIDEIGEAFDAWFGYVSDWQAPKEKTLKELQADIEYIAAMSGIDLEV